MLVTVMVLTPLVLYFHAGQPLCLFHGSSSLSWIGPVGERTCSGPCDTFGPVVAVDVSPEPAVMIPALVSCNRTAGQPIASSIAVDDSGRAAAAELDERVRRALW